MFCCPLSQSLADLLHTHMYTCVETMHSPSRGHVIHHLWLVLRARGPLLGLSPLSDTNEIILCKYAVSVRPEIWTAEWGLLVPQCVMIWQWGGQRHTGLLELEWVTELPRAQKVDIVICRGVVVRLMQVMESDAKRVVCPVTFV